MKRPLAKWPPSALVALGIAVVITVALLCLGIGAVWIPPLLTAKAVLEGMRILPSGTVSSEILAVITMIRGPRVVCGLLAGAGLAASGAVMQGVFRNPLADPGLLGISSGAGLGALLSMIGGYASFAMLPLSAFGGAVVAMALVLVILWACGRQGGGSPMVLMLGGMAVSALFSAFTSLLLTLSNEYQVASYVFWTMGGLTNRRWEHAALLFPVLLTLITLAGLLAPYLDILALGDEEALGLGIRPVRLRIIFILLASGCTAVIVSVAGPIGFVGLMVPHMVRLILGPEHKKLVIGSALMGAVFLALCDTFTRWMGSGQGREYSVGILTAFVGVPFFIYLLISSLRRGRQVL